MICLKLFKATFVYVEMMKFTVDSYLDKSLSPLERIEKAWYANSFARYLKEWISLSDQYILKQNFLTSNAYLYIEFNAHSFWWMLVIMQRKMLYFYHGCLKLTHTRGVYCKRLLQVAQLLALIACCLFSLATFIVKALQ